MGLRYRKIACRFTENIRGDFVDTREWLQKE